MVKKLVSFRLSDNTRSELDACVELLKERDLAEGMEWRASRRDRTDALETAVNWLVDHLRKAKRLAAEAAAAETPKPARKKK